MPYDWQNWIGNRRAVVEQLLTPRTANDLSQDVKRAAASSQGLGTAARPVGASYSWSSLVPTEGMLVQPDGLDRVLAVDPVQHTITVEAGMKLQQLVDASIKHGLTLRSVPIYMDLSVGGLLAVGAHGTGQAWATMCDALLELTLITADGNQVTINKGDPNFEAAAVSLGAAGLIYSAKLQCEPAFNVRVERGFLPAHPLLDRLDDVLATYEFVELYWFLNGDCVWVELMNRSTAPADQDSLLTRLGRQLHDDFAKLTCGAVLPVLARIAPNFTAELMPLLTTIVSPFLKATPHPSLKQRVRNGAAKKALRAAAKVAKPIADELFKITDHYFTEVMTAEEAFHYIHNYAKCWDSEFSIENDPVKVVEAWKAVQNEILLWQKQGRYAVNLSIHARFIGASSPFLSTAEGRPTCCLEVVTLDGTNYAQQFMDRFHQMMMARGGRPHWGKYFTESDIQNVLNQYPNLNRFQQARDQLDPNGVFINPLLQGFTAVRRPP